MAYAPPIRMARPLTYFLTMVGLALFWALVLLGNYVDYAEGSPIFLKPQFTKLFEANRLLLIGAELLFPLVMTGAFVTLALVKLRPRSIRTAAPICGSTSRACASRAA